MLVRKRDAAAQWSRECPNGATRIVSRILRALAWPSQHLIVWSPRFEGDAKGDAQGDGAHTAHAPYAPYAPEGFHLVRLAANDEGANRVAAEAMRAAGEPDGLVAPRLAHGDEFFGWADGGRIVCFGWVMTRDRMVGPFRLTSAPGRMFLYNFHTLPGHRGQGLCKALHHEVRRVLGNETAREFVADVNVRNTASRRCFEKSGFVPVARVSLLTLFGRWHFPLRRTRLERLGVSLF
jgi:ribosomal protein S18 acetylase RimI-like enzyme